MNKKQKIRENVEVKHRLLVVLQNPYNKGKLNQWNPAVWKQEFLTSRTGRRLKDALPTEQTPYVKEIEKWAVHYTNANPKVGNGSGAKHQPNLQHLRRAIKRVQPNILLACGKIAEDATREIWSDSLVCIPHPAYRVVTQKLFERCGKLLLNWGIFRENPAWREQFANVEDNKYLQEELVRISIRQLRGETEIVILP